MEPKKRITSSGEVRWDARARVGKKVVNQTWRTKALAEKWIRETEDAARSGTWVDPALGRQTITTYGTAWIDTRRVKGRPLKARTRETYEDLLKRRIGPQLGDVELRHLTAELVRRWHSKQPDGPYTAKAYRLLHAICETALDDGIIPRQPCRIKGAGSDNSPERPLIPPDELAALVLAIEDRARAIVLLAGWCGLRAGEVLALEVRHVDVARRTITIDQAIERLKGAPRTIGTPKSDAGERVVVMPVFVAKVVEQHLDEFTPNRAPDAPLFVGLSGRPVQARTLWRWWDEARTEIGHPEYHFHDLRHAAGTMAAWTGATTKEIMARLGHASERAALRYQHAAHDRDRELADALDAVAGGSFERPTPIRPREGRAMGPGTTKAQEAG